MNTDIKLRNFVNVSIVGTHKPSIKFQSYRELNVLLEIMGKDTDSIFIDRLLNKLDEYEIYLSIDEDMFNKFQRINKNN